MFRVLIVEDDPTARSALCDLLEIEGYLVETAARGDVAIERHRAEPFDLLLTDLGLPDVDGLARIARGKGCVDGLAVARIAREEKGCAVLIMTGSERARHEDLGFEVLMKPIDFEELLVKMRRALAARTW